MKSFKIGDLTIPVPIVQGGMGIGISLSGLASAVASEGGIGTIASVGLGLIYGTPDKTFRQNNKEAFIHEIQKARQLTKGILAVNIMSVLTNFTELVQTAIQEKIDIIFSGAGLPLDLPQYKPKESNTKLVPIVSSARAAKIIAKKWFQNYNYLPDAFVVEGPKAGGHLGFSLKELQEDKHDLKTLVLEVLNVTEELAKEYNKEIPVIAAGGISDGKKMRELMDMGVAAVQLGTSFVATKECDASDDFKNEFIKAGADKIRLIQSPVGLPGRAIENDFLLAAERGEKKPQRCKHNCIKSCNPKTTNYCIADALLAAYQGRLESGFAFSGAYGYKIQSLTSVQDIINRYLEEYNEGNEII